MSKTRDSVTITLDTPLVRGDKQITEIVLTKPSSGALRGTTLSDLIALDVSTLCRVLPRISTPALTERELSNMDPSDLILLGMGFVGFLSPNSVRESLPQG